MIPPNVNEADKQAEWRGYMLKAVEDIDKELSLLRVKVEKLDDNLSVQNAKVAGISATITIILTLIMQELFK